MDFFETSAKTGINIQEVFFAIAKNLKDQKEKEGGKGGAGPMGVDNSVKLKKGGAAGGAKGGKKGCC